MKIKIIQGCTLILLMLVTGVFWGTWFTLTRSLAAFQASEFMHIGQVIISNVAWPMRIIFPAAILFLLLMLWTYPDKRSAGFYTGLIALLLLVAALVVTLAILVPIDNQIRTWTPETVPGNWEQLRSKWDYFHTVRTFLSLVSFGCCTAAVLYPYRLSRF